MMEAIVLAGGLGTRLRSEVSDRPKSMAEIKGRPFLEYLFDHLIDHGVERIVLSVGYMSHAIEEHFKTSYRGCELAYALEETRLGTGGAIKHAMRQVQSKHVIIVNGDSIFLSDIRAQLQLHLEAKADVSLALKPMRNFARYGTVDLDEHSRILRFNEKQAMDEGLINAGVYIFSVEAFNSIDFPDVFSIEKEFFESKLEQLKFIGVPSGGYFLDIGIPSDFKRAQSELGVLPNIDKSWSLFLDRDGVINRKRDNDYVKNLDELELLPKAVDSIVYLSSIFGNVFIVTNQQGIGKGLMSEADLKTVHDHIRNQVEEQGGSIDAIYHAPQLAAENSNMRKPNTGMAQKAKEEFEGVELQRSIMVGDSPSDMEFGTRAGMVNVHIVPSQAESNYYTQQSLEAFTSTLKSILDFRQ